jgi:hypothetical protein
VKRPRNASAISRGRVGSTRAGGRDEGDVTSEEGVLAISASVPAPHRSEGVSTGLMSTTGVPSIVPATRMVGIASRHFRLRMAGLWSMRYRYREAAATLNRYVVRPGPREAPIVGRFGPATANRSEHTSSSFMKQYNSPRKIYVEFAWMNCRRTDVKMKARRRKQGEASKYGHP